VGSWTGNHRGILASAATSMVGGSTATKAFSVIGGESGARNSDPNAYFVDNLLRSDRPASDANENALRTEIGRIFANGLTQRDVPAADRAYLVQLVTAKTGLNPSDAEKRVSDFFTSATSLRRSP
jgi:hypothetical protein